MKTRRQLWWREKKSRWKGERTARPEHQMMLATTTIHIQSSCMAKMDAFRSSIADRPYPPYRLRRRLLRHISLVKSQEDNQWIQLKRALIKGPVPTPYTIKHSFRLTFRERRTVSSLMLFISRAWDVLILLVFPHDYICAFLIIWKPYQL